MKAKDLIGREYGTAIRFPWWLTGGMTSGLVGEGVKCAKRR